jgi:two-component system sensor histidine kinase TctE
MRRPPAAEPGSGTLPGGWRPRLRALRSGRFGDLIGQVSLHRQLLLWLLLPQLVLWGAAAAVTYNVAARYANRGIDASLLQATRALARQVKPIGNGLFIDFPRAAQDIIEADPVDRVYYMVSTPPGQFILGSRKLPAPPDDAPVRPGEPLFYDGLLDGQLRVRIAALYLPIGEPAPGAEEEAPRELMLVQIARSQASRDELARSILLDTVLPLSVLIVLMTMIVWAGIRAGLAPLARLQRQVEDRAPNDPTPVSLHDAPQEVRALARALNSLLAAVHESVAAQRRFISHAAHQLRTPLAGLKSQTEIALQSNADPALDKRLQLVHQSAVRSAHLINQLMALTRAEPEAAANLPRSRVDLQALVVDLLAEVVPRALQAGIDLGFDAGEEGAPDEEAGALAGAGEGAAAALRPAALPSAEPAEPALVQGNALLLREAVSNLVDNALRYAGRGAEVTVQLVRPRAGWLQLRVRDSGPGLAAAQLETVFERFVRGRDDGQGCGLGLAIVREIAERHDGRVWLEPAAPRGLCAVLELPAQASTMPPGAGPATGAAAGV